MEPSDITQFQVRSQNELVAEDRVQLRINDMSCLTIVSACLTAVIEESTRVSNCCNSFDTGTRRQLPRMRHHI